MSRLAGLFDSCRAEGRSGLIGYLPTGFPDVDTSIQAMVALVVERFGRLDILVANSGLQRDAPFAEMALAD